MERQEKKALFEEKKKRGIVPLFAIVLLLLAAVGAGAWWLGGSGGSSVSAVDGRVSIPLAEVQDGKAHFYAFRSGGTDVRFFVLKSNDGVIRAAFDACDVCYRDKKGYRQQGDQMICNNCDQAFSSNRINEVRGGCNPAPLERTIVGDRLLVAEAELAAGARYFR